MNFQELLKQTLWRNRKGHTKRFHEQLETVSTDCFAMSKLICIFFSIRGEERNCGNDAQSEYDFLRNSLCRETLFFLLTTLPTTKYVERYQTLPVVFVRVLLQVGRLETKNSINKPSLYIHF